MKPRLILVADSSERGLTLLHQVLVHLGYSVVLAASGNEAVAQAARHRPDAILLDLHLDEGEPMTTLRALATHGWAATTPVIALADAATAPIPSARFAAVVQKPIVLDALARVLEGCLPAPRLEPVENRAPVARVNQRSGYNAGSRSAIACG